VGQRRGSSSSARRDPDCVAGAGPVVWFRSGDDSARSVALDQARLEHFMGSVPWRRWRSRQGQAHPSGSYWAATMGGHVVYESRLELARLLLADFDPAVVNVWAQPCRLVATVGGIRRHHVPDFLLASPEGAATVVNVKPARCLDDPVVAQALAWPEDLFASHGWRYEVWSGCDAVLLENVRFLAGYRRPAIVAEDLVERAWREVRDGDALGEVERRLAGDGPGWSVRPALLALLWRGRLVTDLSRTLSSESMLCRRG
jgi:hypothetical protein